MPLIVPLFASKRSNNKPDVEHIISVNIRAGKSGQNISRLTIYSCIAAVRYGHNMTHRVILPAEVHQERSFLPQQQTAGFIMP